MRNSFLLKLTWELVPNYRKIGGNKFRYEYLLKDSKKILTKESEAIPGTHDNKFRDLILRVGDKIFSTETKVIAKFL
jgi:hypothetical protein